MLDPKFIREHPDRVRAGLKAKGVEFDVDAFLKLDERRRAKIGEVDQLRAKQNTASDAIATLAPAERETTLGQMRDLKTNLTKLEDELKTIEAEYDERIRQIPNLPLDDVPHGKDDRDNVVLREVGERPVFSFPVRDNIELGEELDIIDTARAAKISGSRFGYLKREAALLEFALVQYAFSVLTNRAAIADILKEEGLDLSDEPFVPVVPPVMVRPEVMRAMGYMERGGDEIYRVADDDLLLVGTSEQSIGPMHMNEMLAEESLPRRYVGFSTCFRREAGSYGKDTRGILRVHQFDKVEMFSFTLPESSRAEHRLFLALEERFFRGLGIPYRVLNICAGDLGDSAAAKFDIEAWLPGENAKQGQYREVTSTSNTTDFQSRRLNVKVRRANNQAEHPHLVNGTAFAIGRTLIAILENYQREDGSVEIPEVLQSFLPGITEIRRT
ncbi:serine--tRNA ligase [Candidatus Parcubacteria bacterium]|nr:MAG: serine--tRNA ligase [Candidatus Parcubacteria bacterium]